VLDFYVYVATMSGFVYIAFGIDVFSRMIVGWRGCSENDYQPAEGRSGHGRLAPWGEPYMT
jgi:hypothetical protein